MSIEADTQGGQFTQGLPSAGGQELSIPKHRFDEIQARLRETQEQNRLKDQLLQQLSAQRQQQEAPQARRPKLTPEELGVDPQTYSAAQKIAKSIVEEEVLPQFEQAKQFIGGLKNELEETRFLQKNPKAEVYLDAIREFRMRHWQNTGGGWIDVENAYKIVKHDELIRRAQSADPTIQVPASPSQNPASASQGQAPGMQQQVPNPASTRPALAQGGTSGGAAGGSHEESLEEMEARLEQQFASGALL